MSMKKNQQKVKPEVIKAQIELPNKGNISINSNAVTNSGKYISPDTIIKKLKKAAQDNIFPPLVTS